ncbi:MAG: purine-binding chemotaxis protein CheW [Acidobacteria bacterium]|nr:purine-binding chemotaxis protein CheW [Acidobacteriota bacterium]MBK8810053.1 purine-binding chemotaxis protein CheW [Acidobacteriota bacterium]
MENLTLSVNADIDLSSVLDLNDPDENIGSVSECEKFVVFQIEGEFFALPAVAVKEVAHPLPLTHLPDSPTWLQGLSNLRGDIVAIVNFNLGKSAPRITPKSKIVIFKTPQFDTLVGILADKISEIVAIPGSSIERTEDPNILARATINGNSIGLFDIDRFFASITKT